jgi:hypothetical protein
MRLSPLSTSEREKLVADVHAGRVVLEVDREFAKKIYTSVPMDTMERTIGEVPYFEKGIVCSALFASPVALIVGIALLAFGLKWWIFVAAPAAVVLWFLNRTRSKNARAGIVVPTALLVAAVASCFVGPIHDAWISIGLLSFATAIWCDRLIYVESARFLRAQVLRNPRALEAYADGLVIRRVD